MTHVLVPIDGSPPSWDALDYAIETFAGERITVLNVVDPLEGMYADEDGSYYDPEMAERARERGAELGEEARERLDAAGALSTTEFESAVETGRVARTINEYVEEHDVDHVVIGSHGREGVSRILLGSVSEKVARRATVPVTIIR
ncbi:MAG: universal stress protein [Haloferacaceae archaeon]